ncbi:pyrimidine dimer DNA glycosylase/endonuclease V [Corallincola platygyrae]|uniref:Pyrimidine dimer DNA glycosylase/endonuclease V n=1 Tax=Corallincola platygyrae TaxID=1193278 RepID=A0ABW4XKU3_9GAMM
MKIWDVNPGYLSRQLLLAEHTELHSIHQLIETQLDGVNQMKPSLLRWIYHPAALALRHAAVVEEMRLRGIEHKTAMPVPTTASEWPSQEGDWNAATQYAELADKGQEGRIPLPVSLEILWEQHAYSVMARDAKLFKRLQIQVASKEIEFDSLANLLVDTLRRPCHQHHWDMVVEGMWEPCKQADEAMDYSSSYQRPNRLIRGIQYLASEYKWPELWHATALCELSAAVRVN